MNLKRYFKIFLLCWEAVFQDRSRVFVWFLSSIANPLIFLLFWKGAYRNQSSINGWNFTQVAAYYLLFIVGGAALVSQVHIPVIQDIKEGQLSSYIVKPLSYHVFNFLTESPYRILQGIFGIMVLIFSLAFFIHFSFASSMIILFLSCVTALLGYCISFTYKVVLSFAAFWLIEIKSLIDLFDILVLVFGGFVMPIFFFPPVLQTISNLSPFPYMVYYPVLAFLGKLNISDILSILAIQGIWLSILLLIYEIMWHFGLRQFTGVGQ